MIAWMQKHNKYLVVTIWVATIAFIGAGFVGWGTYQYGSKAGAIAQVGEIPITQEKFNFTYQNLYRQMAELNQGNFDDAKAKKMGLDKMVYQRLVSQAMLLNLAREYGIVVSEKELASEIEKLPAFRVNGHFDKRTYLAFLDARRLKPRTFEGILRDDLTIEKLMSLLNQDAVPFEKEVIAAALSVSDRIRYRVLDQGDVNLTVKDEELKKYWEAHKTEYQTPKKYKLSLLWTTTDDINASEQELKDFYTKNSFNYTDAQGKEFGFEKARPLVLQDYRIKKGKKKALLDYIAFKKGKKEASAQQELAVGDATLSKALWDQIATASPGTILKPKPVGTRYATVKVEGVTPPRPMSFEEAKPLVEKEWKASAAKKALEKKAEEMLKDKMGLTEESGWISLTQSETLPPLSATESRQFLQKLFTSDKKEGIIDIMGKKVIYVITEQKMASGENNVTQRLAESGNGIKKGEFEQTLLKELYTKYPVKSFVKGF
ncbi:peptidylprolyl isomerase [Nitratifractor sp.]